nr:hypothetical protein [Lachnospiraceae bacterium]
YVRVMAEIAFYSENDVSLRKISTEMHTMLVESKRIEELENEGKIQVNLPVIIVFWKYGSYLANINNYREALKFYDCALKILDNTKDFTFIVIKLAILMEAQWCLYQIETMGRDIVNKLEKYNQNTINTINELGRSIQSSDRKDADVKRIYSEFTRFGKLRANTEYDKSIISKELLCASRSIRY